MLRHFRPAITALIAFTLLLGLIYPLAITALAAGLAPNGAKGSLVATARGPVGSALIGQNFVRPEYLHPRPSAAGDGYDPTQSGGANLGPLDPKLETRIAASVKALGVAGASVPVDAVTASASGLDPDISPEFARLQIDRIAKARNAAPRAVASLVESHVRGRFLGVIGEPRVNVLETNLALDQRFGPMPR